MNRIKKIIGVIVVTMFLSALTLNFGLFRTASADMEPGKCRCKDDPGDTCVCYGVSIPDCDEAYWWQSADCNE